MDAGAIITSLGAAVGGLAGLAALVRALMQRGVVKAGAAETVTDTALELMTALKADAQATRADLTATRAELAEVRVEAESLAGRLRGLISAIHSPLATIEQLRAMVPMGQGSNGHGPN